MNTPIPPELQAQRDRLNPAQRKAVEHSGSPLLILAGAGSGKTRVITTKLAYLIAAKDYEPWSLLAVTFTKKAANEMAERACALDARASASYIKTFHSFGAWLLRRYPEAAGVSPRFTVYDDDDSAALLSHARPELTRQEAARYAHKIALAKDYCLAPDSAELARIDYAPEFPAIYRAYQTRLRESGNVDFGDLIMLPVTLLAENDAVRARLRSRFRAVMVDEYQDSNVAQFKLLRQLVGDETYVCAVGDDDQSIYRFRGAEVQNILSFQEQFAGTELIRLEENYRSFAPILEVANSVVSKNRDRLGKTLRARRKGGEKPALYYLGDQDEETRLCANLIERTHKSGSPYADWAVLYRTNAQSRGFESEFLRRSLPYAVVGSLKFYEREEVKDMLACLALAANPRDEIAFRRAANKPARGVGAAAQDKIAAQEPASFLDKCRAALPSLSKRAAAGTREFAGSMAALCVVLDEADPVGKAALASEPGGETGAPEGGAAEWTGGRLSAFVNQAAELSGLSSYYREQDDYSGSQRTANIQELANAAAPYPLSWSGLLDFLDHIELDRSLASESAEADRDAVTLITLHNTKGLEFRRVIITGLEHGVFPREDKFGKDLEEERRLFYVGITRARDELYLTCCQQRRVYGRTERLPPSPFLSEIDPALLAVSDFRAPSGYAHGSRFAEKWRVGTKLYHDEYGYGAVVSSAVKGGELVITARFENGGEKRFLPQYQGGSLMQVEAE